MQYILTEEEYIILKDAHDQHQFCNPEIALLTKEIKRLEVEHKKLQEKYNKLLVFGVSSSNERLKGVRQ